jgi:hypothetical protein
VSDDGPLELHLEARSASAAQWLAEQPRHKVQRRTPVLQVRFATGAETLATLEGTMAAHAGDAIITGAAGEHWPVPRAEFEARYAPESAVQMGQPGLYRKKPGHAWATQLPQPAVLVLPAGSLHGKAGDWLVEQPSTTGQPSYSIVAQALFEQYYEAVAPDGRTECGG